MRYVSRQDGIGMIALIGLIAALAISAAGLTILMLNTQAFTYADQTRTKAFNVSEGALNVGMSTLQAQWPRSAATPAAFPTPIFRGQYAPASFPDPTTGSFINVVFFDNTSTSPTGTISPTTSPVYDAGGPGAPTTPDNQMYIRATAKVGNGVATIQGLVQRTFWNPSVPRGVAAYSGGAIEGNAQGGGTMPKILVGRYGPPVTPDNPLGQATAYAAEGYDPLGIMQSGTIAVKTGADVPELDQVVFPDIINGIKLTAIQGGRYFFGANAVQDALDSPLTEMGGPGLQGLTYIEPAAGTSGTCILPQNTVDTPALFFLMGGNNWSFVGGGHGGGQADAYGFFYTQGNCDFLHGGPTIHGSMIAAGDIGFIGGPQIEYDDRVWINMTQHWTLNVKLVPNTWRELSPGVAN